MKCRYLDPKIWFPFKRVFEENPELLKSFLNALMPFGKNQHIESFEYMPFEKVPETPAKIDSVMAVNCTDNRGRQFIVDIQMHWTTLFSNRMVINASGAYVRQAGRQIIYSFPQPLYCLGIVNDIFDKETEEYYHHYKTVRYEDNNETIEGLESVMIELPKFNPTSPAKNKMTTLWLRFLKEIIEDKYIEPAPELLKNKYIRKAIAMCEEGAYTEGELYACERAWDEIRIEKSLLNDRERREKEYAEGLEKGRKKAKENAVVKSFQNGVSLDLISSITDLPKAELISILQKHKLIK